MKLETKTKAKIRRLNFVLEFGGGYGNMCKLFKQFKFKGKYVIFDLPCFCTLQKYYLKSHGYKILGFNDFLESKTGITCISDYEELKIILKKNHFRENCLFVAMWSISEAPINLRKKILTLLGNFSFFLIAFQKEFEKIDNLRYFRKIQKEFKGVKWNEIVIKKPRRNYYLIGEHKITKPS